jgi:succinoglycan biosynthesis transport protein ExoP
MDETVGQDASPISEYLRIIKRRRWLVAGIATVVIAVAVAAAVMLPLKYRSTATIVIEEPAIADDSSRAAGATYADQRLQLIQQRVMTTAKLIEVIDRVGLYREVREVTPDSVLVDDMRSRIDMQLVGSDSDAKSSRQAKATIAFTLSYIGQDPAVTQQTTRELVNLYLAENEQSQHARAVGTAGFLSGESDRLAARIKDLESQLADFKTANAGMLPEEMEFNVQVLDRTQNQILELMRQTQAARERQAFLQAQLLSLEPQAPVNAATPETLSPKARLRLLKAQYATLVSKYGDKHPDVVRLRRQIDATAGSGAGGQSATDLQQLEAQLIVANEKYGDAHPDVMRLKRQIEAAKAAFVGQQAAEEAPDNPIYIQTQGQINAVNAELSTLQSQIATLQKKMNQVESQIIKTPETERGYVALKREYDTAVEEFSELKKRGNQAELAKNLETEQMGQRLTLIEPPPLPAGPFWPNRKAIVLLGIICGLASGIVAAILIDSLDGRIHGSRRLAAIVGAGPLVLVPRIAVAYDPKPRRHRFAMLALSVIVAFGVLMGNVDLSSLDTFWTSVLNTVQAQ